MQAGLRMFQNRVHLGAFHAWKPFKEFIHGRSVFQVFEQSTHGNPRSAKNPRPTDPLRVALYCKTVMPVIHRVRLLDPP